MPFGSVCGRVAERSHTLGVVKKVRLAVGAVFVLVVCALVAYRLASTPQSEPRPPVAAASATGTATERALEHDHPPQRSAPPVTQHAAQLSGRVVDERARVVEGAALRIEVSGRERAAGSSDANGRFSFSGLPAGGVTLSAVTGRHRPHRREYELVAGQPLDVEIVLSTGRVLAGRVVDRAGRPIAGASVGTSDDSAFAVSSDDGGEFELLGLGEQPLTLFASKPGYAPRHERGVRPGARGVTLRLDPEAILSGLVEWAPNVEAATVSVCSFDSHFERELCTARVLLRPGQSEFRLAGIAEGRHDVVVEIGDREIARTRVLVRAGELVTVPTLRVEPRD